MAFYRAQVSIPRDSGLPEDATVNTFHFDSDSPIAVGGDLDNITTRLTAFYQTFDQTMALYNDNPVTVTYYDLSEPSPRPPLRTDSFTLTYTTGSSFPGEVAIALSYEAAVLAGVNPARRRGRIFLGPWSNVGIVSNGDMYVDPAIITLIVNGAVGLATPPGAGLPMWAVFSPTTLAEVGATLDDAFHDVVGGWVDNALDTQRRRGPQATSRTLWSPP